MHSSYNQRYAPIREHLHQTVMIAAQSSLRYEILYESIALRNTVTAFCPNLTSLTDSINGLQRRSSEQN